MKITRLRVAELKQFRTPFELADIQGGLNIFTGANEAGKSTLVRAIRAAFFERHRSTSVDDLRPYGDSVATPAIELDFDIQGTPHRLSKSFLHKKRCELQVGTRRLEGVEAEDALAEQLGFQFPGKGASKKEQWGIPGLLWIEQGSAQTLRDSVEFASNHLRKALDESLGEVAASGGDDIVRQLSSQREELLTDKGKPRAIYLKALEDSAELELRVTELRQLVAQYQNQVDQLKQLRDGHLADVKSQPWETLRAQQAQAQQDLQAAEALAEESRRAQEQLNQAAGLRELLQQRLVAAELQRQQLGTREATLATAAKHHELALSLEAQAVQADQLATQQGQASRVALALARQEDNRQLLSRQATEAQARAAELATQLAHAKAESERATRLRSEAAHLRVEAGDLNALRTQAARLNELRIQQAAIATRLRFELDAGATIRVGNEDITGAQERLLLEATTIRVPGVGALHITPGGHDLADLAQQQQALLGEHAALLQRLGLATLAEVEARAQAHGQRLAEAQAADKACKLIAPKGVDALKAEQDNAQARQAEASAALTRLPPPPASPALVPALVLALVLALETAEREHELARVSAERAAQQLQSARQALATTASQLQAAQRERDALKAALERPELQAELASQQRELTDANARVASLQTDLQAIAARVAAARPDILKQDVERYKRSAKALEDQHQARSIQLAQLEAALAAAGARGLEEELAETEGQFAQAQRRAGELRRRAEALNFLLNKLQARRQALTRRLQAPLQKHLNHYLQLLFPNGQLAVDENLVPGELSRSGPRGPESGDFETLSFGAREQMGVISRLAYADLLKEAGRPTLIILDDALVHSDETRLAQMKRVLFDAAQRHQVLLFTCHPGNWRDMGVPLRALETIEKLRAM